jgi:hypothetical protein
MSGEEERVFRDALVSAFDLSSFDQMLRFRLNITRQDIVADAGMRTVSFDVIQTANREGWLDRLVEAAIDERPQNAALRNFAISLKAPSEKEVNTRPAIMERSIEQRHQDGSPKDIVAVINEQIASLPPRTGQWLALVAIVLWIVRAAAYLLYGPVFVVTWGCLVVTGSIPPEIEWIRLPGSNSVNAFCCILANFFVAAIFLGLVGLVFTTYEYFLVFRLVLTVLIFAIAVTCFYLGWHFLMTHGWETVQANRITGPLDTLERVAVALPMLMFVSVFVWECKYAADAKKRQ